MEQTERDQHQSMLVPFQVFKPLTPGPTEGARLVRGRSPAARTTLRAWS